MIRIPPDLLTQPAEKGARRVALHLLEEANSALPKVGDVDEGEALHDFRVNLRRLRSCLSAYLPYLERRSSIRAVEQIRALGRQTNAARDYEVQIDWLREQVKTLRPGHRRALSALVRDLERRKRDAYSRVLEGVPKRFARLRHALRPHLEAVRTWVQVDAAAAASGFAEASGALLRGHAAALKRTLASIRTPDDEATAHEARIQAKRLRHLLEPVSPHVDGGKAALKHLKGLQDLLGELNDLRALRRSIAGALEKNALTRGHRLLDAVRAGDTNDERRARRADLERGILAVARLAEERRQHLFGDLAAKWLGAQGSALFVEFDAIAGKLANTGSRGVEIERKFLLRALPELVGRAAPADVEQGWLPGSDIRERVSRVSARGQERFFRTVKLGSGMRRSEFEDEIPREVFEQLWPLTEGCRVRKRRYTLPVGEVVWEIDDFADRDLVLAEVELPSEDTAVQPPDWLAPYLDREVTGDPRYLNLNLAR